jgi:hypothetical protein
MLKVKDIMTKEVISVSPETEIANAAKILLEKRINGMPVMDAFGRLVGIICQSDLVVQQKAIPVPSVFTLLESYIPLTSIKRIDKEMKNRYRGGRQINGRQQISHPARCGGRQSCRNCRQGGCVEDIVIQTANQKMNLENGHHQRGELHV